MCCHYVSKCKIHMLISERIFQHDGGEHLQLICLAASTVSSLCTRLLPVFALKTPARKLFKFLVSFPHWTWAGGQQMQQCGSKLTCHGRMVSNKSPSQQVNILCKILIFGVIFPLIIFIKRPFHDLKALVSHSVNMICTIFTWQHINVTYEMYKYGYYSLYSVNKSVSMTGGFLLNTTDVSSGKCTVKKRMWLQGCERENKEQIMSWTDCSVCIHSQYGHMERQKHTCTVLRL